VQVHVWVVDAASPEHGLGNRAVINHMDIECVQEHVWVVDAASPEHGLQDFARTSAQRPCPRLAAAGTMLPIQRRLRDLPRPASHGNEILLWPLEAALPGPWIGYIMLSN